MTVLPKVCSIVSETAVRRYAIEILDANIGIKKIFHRSDSRSSYSPSCDILQESQAGMVVSFEEEDGESVILQAGQLLLLWRAHSSSVAFGPVYIGEEE